MVTSIIISVMKDMLRKWRESNERRSDEVVELWMSIMGMNEEGQITSLGNESKFVYFKTSTYLPSPKYFFLY